MNMRKCKGIEEVAVMEVTAEEEEEVSVSMTGARAVKLKKRKTSGAELELSFSSSVVQIKHHRRIAFTVENSTSPEASENSNNNLSSPNSDHAPASCCSSNASSQLAKQNFKVIDLQEEEASSVEMATSETNDIENEERSETAPVRDLQAESVELESATTTPPSEADSRRRSPAKMPSDAEIEEFFSAAEKDIQKQFAEKYNFDFVKEEPLLEGRYEWVPVKP